MNILSKIPDAFCVDYKNVDDVCVYQLLLCKIFEREGGLNLPETSNAITRQVKKQGQVWLREVEFLLHALLDDDPMKAHNAGGENISDLSVIPDLIHSYDFFYRVSNGTPCYDYIREIKLKTLQCWLGGNKTISLDELVLLLLSDIRHDIHKFENKYIDFALKTQSLWIEELIEFSAFKGTSTFETYRRLTSILQQDLFAYVNKHEEQKLKTQWTKKYLLSDNDIDCLSTKDLQAYIEFSNAALRQGCYPGKTYGDFDDEYTRLISLLASRSDLSHYTHAALRLELADLAASKINLNGNH